MNDVDFMSLAKLVLVREEGIVNTVYDDKTGKSIGPGTALVGIPTIAIGHNLLVPMSKNIMDMLFVEDFLNAKEGAKVWLGSDFFNNLDVVRAVALASFVFQVGLGGARKFVKATEAIKRHQWPLAAEHMNDSKWAKTDSPQRAARVAYMVRTGIVPMGYYAFAQQAFNMDSFRILNLTEYLKKTYSQGSV